METIKQVAEKMVQTREATQSRASAGPIDEDTFNEMVLKSKAFGDMKRDVTAVKTEMGTMGAI
eukprot:9179477-Karenia_brevis.AAC.1